MHHIGNGMWYILQCGVFLEVTYKKIIIIEENK